MPWLFVNSGLNSAAYNMALDEACMEAVQRKECTFILRVYGWKPWAISIGYAQKARREFDLKKIKAARFGFVRRATGGRAVLHAEELTYSIIASANMPAIGKNLYETYNIIGMCLLESLRMAGMCGLSLEKAKLSETGAGRAVSKPCFSSTSRYEIVWQGRKVVGSAQKRTKDVVVQHGAILLGDAYARIIDYMNTGAEEKLKYRDELKNNAVSLGEISGKKINYDNIAGVFAKGFEKVLGREIIEQELPENIAETAREIEKEKYVNDKWNLMR